MHEKVIKLTITHQNISDKIRMETSPGFQKIQLFSSFNIGADAIR